MRPKYSRASYCCTKAYPIFHLKRGKKKILLNKAKGHVHQNTKRNAWEMQQIKNVNKKASAITSFNILPHKESQTRVELIRMHHHSTNGD